ncbi:MAG: ankyrin repeat domain-containing protein [Burkholderiales bacterium]|nr:ankyrin repeat domain-containing protein [Burkholderiales bacterium]
MRYLLYLFVSIWFSLASAGSYDDFFAAVLRDDVAVVRDLLNRGFDPNTPSPKGETGLLLAVKAPAPKVTELLLSQVATRVEVRNASDESPLMLAALSGNADLCLQLIRRDADVNKPGWTPLHYAATGGHMEAIRVLLENHAYIDAGSPNGTTPLMMAAMYGTSGAVKLLLESGADPTLKNAQGLTAIDFAMRVQKNESIDIISAFVRARNTTNGW